MRDSGDEGRRILHLPYVCGCGRGCAATRCRAERDCGRGCATKTLEVGGVAGEDDPGDTSAADYRGCSWLSRAAAASQGHGRCGDVTAAAAVGEVNEIGRASCRER